MDYIELETLLKGVADKSRLQILERIHQGQRCGCELLSSLDISQPTLSHHLKVLSKAGFIEGIKTRNKIHYTVQIKQLEKLKESLDFLLQTEPLCEVSKNENI